MSVKAFELIPAVERVKLMGDKARTQIECIDCCGKNLYIGTNDCFVVHYFIEEKAQSNGRVTYHSEKQGHKYLAVKKPVVQVKAASALNRIMVLCDNTLTLLNMFDLEPILSGAKIRGVVSFCLNENPVKASPFSVEICVALKKRQVQIYTVTEDRMIHLKDVGLPEPPLNMKMDHNCICIACTSQYLVANYETGQTQDLFPYEHEFTTPLVLRIGRDEFLVSGPSALGMFVTSAGNSQRPPLQWSDRLVSIGYLHPYILAMNDEFITVHSILDQQQKQSIPFQGGKFLGEFDGRLLVSSGKEIYGLMPVAWEKQIQGLLVDKRVSEALELAKNARTTAANKEKFQKLYRRIQQQAAFIEFSECRFDEAKELFKDGQIDVREVLTLYPNIMPDASTFMRSQPPLHEIADINQLSRGSKDRVMEYKRFLKKYLEEIKEENLQRECAKEIDTALVKLYAETNSAELVTLLAMENSFDPKDCVECLQNNQKYYALGLMYQFHGENDKALSIWTKLADGEYKDESFPGFEFVVEFLANLDDQDLIWKYVDWVLAKNQEIGIKVFTERPPNESPSEKMRPDTIIDYLDPVRFPDAVIMYLEYLVFQKKLEKEKYHTHLAVLYLDAVLKLRENQNSKKEDLDKARSKLRHMLQMSNLYRVQLILGKVKETDMYAEMAILYGKLDEHDKALRILVHKLKDFGQAENYCIINSKGKEPHYRKRLFQILLGVYLDPTYERSDLLVMPAISLLNNNEADFDTIKVLQQLPDNWSVSLLSQFLHRSVRTSLDNSRTTRIQTTLSRGENLQVKQTVISACRNPILVKEDKTCAVCNRVFSEPTFVRYPNGVMCHTHCSRSKYVCPVTGRMFSAKK